LVRLTASLRVRADRVHAILPDLAPSAPSRIIDRKDDAARAKIRAAWALAADAVRACEWRSDLVVQCPSPIQCSDPKECEAITVALVTAGYRVYRHYLGDGSTATTAIDDVLLFRDLLRAHPQRIRRCSPLLTDPADRFSEWNWRRRLLIELGGR
jgi:hypothetical protein